jgi:tetratricopeptide (TPR) repeat protein
MAAKHPAHVGAYLALAERFSAAGEHEQGAKNYELAAKCTTRPHKKIQWLIEAATQLTSAKKLIAAEGLLRAAAELLQASPESEAEALGQMSFVWKDLGKTDLFLACAERCLELAPDRANPRFALAHTYSDLQQRLD